MLQLAFSDRAKGRALGVNGSFGSIGRALYPSLFFIVAALAISQADTVAIFAGLGILTAVVIAAGLGELHRPVLPLQGSRGPRASEPSTEIVTTEPGLGAGGSAAVQTATSGGRSIRAVLDRSVLVLMAVAFFVPIQVFPAARAGSREAVDRRW